MSIFSLLMDIISNTNCSVINWWLYAGNLNSFSEKSTNINMKEMLVKIESVCLVWFGFMAHQPLYII